ncbi:MAG: glutamine--fructose-6-phosphate transaminase (isomerizing) [Clostridia bacterium]|nr:glutamine--fructose-6-phosphate transaminase (isomerizing) [Clostridia bacterium]
MCGIMGYIGEENATEIIISGLEALEYRGYDSAGIAVYSYEDIICKKCIGSPAELKEKTSELYSNIGIGHNRWATHGRADEINAHPHLSQNGIFAVVHNGIIENYEKLKTELMDKGYNFVSETDTEVIAHLIEENYKGDLKGAVSATLPLLEGSYALAILCKDYPDTIVCAKRSSPLFVGTDSNSAYIASDISALTQKSKRIFRLNDGEIGLLTKDSFKVYDTDGCRIKKSEIKIKNIENNINKDGYEHFMLKEIMEQPASIRKTLSEIFDGRKIRFKGLKWSANDIKQINNVHFVACGSAYHAGMVGAYVCTELFKRNSTAEIASEFRYSNPCIDKNTLIVIISQSGETADTLAALRIANEKNAKVISIVNVENSTISLESKNTIFTKAGPEIAVATTKAYSAQLAAIYSLVLYLAVISGELKKIEAVKYIDELKRIPEKIETILNQNIDYKTLSEKILNSEYICFIGRNYEYCTVMEASLKLKEISYIPCEAYAAGELKHGTISLIDKNSLVIALCCSDRLSSKTLSNVNETKARGAEVLTVVTKKISGDIIIPETIEIYYPLLEIIPLQLLAYNTALIKGCEIDKPKNLAKSVTVE